MYNIKNLHGDREDGSIDSAAAVVVKCGDIFFGIQSKGGGSSVIGIDGGGGGRGGLIGHVGLSRN